MSKVAGEFHQWLERKTHELQARVSELEAKSDVGAVPMVWSIWMDFEGGKKMTSPYHYTEADAVAAQRKYGGEIIPLYAALQQPAQGQEPVGVACKSDYDVLTEACFRKDKVPVGTKLYVADTHKKEPGTCRWDEDDGMWSSECGFSLFYEDGTPSECGQRFCPKCGNECLESNLKARPTGGE